jgi:hypothetical protein
LLEPAGRVSGLPLVLQENRGIAFNGIKMYGQGFLISPEEAARWIHADPRLRDVLLPYLSGEDVNGNPEGQAPRWAIDFNNLSLEAASTYTLPMARVQELVKPERERASKAVASAPWWLPFRSRPALRAAIRSLKDVLVITAVSKTVMPFRVPRTQVFSHSLNVFASESYVLQAVLSSSLHQLWAVTYGSTMRTDVRYTPSDVFETFPCPVQFDGLERLGRTLDDERREIMLGRNLGLTKLYNLVNDPQITDSSDPDVARMRAIHVELDQAVMDAYGWPDVPLDHGFHTYRQMQRWTVSPTARVEILDRLLEENHRRAAEEGKQTATPKSKVRQGKKVSDEQGTLL